MISHQNRLGAGARSPRWATAFKFKGIIYLNAIYSHYYYYDLIMSFIITISPKIVWVLGGGLLDGLLLLNLKVNK